MTAKWKDSVPDTDREGIETAGDVQDDDGGRGEDPHVCDDK